MSSYKITDVERVEALSTMHPLPYFVHEQYVMKMLGYGTKDELNTFMNALKRGGSLSLNGSTLDPIDIDSPSNDNDLHIHRHNYGDKKKTSSRRTITDVACVDVVNQKEIYYSFGLFQREANPISLPNQIQIIRHVTGQYLKGYNSDEIERRQSQWQKMCAFGNRGQQQSYFNFEMAEIVEKFHQALGIDAWEDEGIPLELLKQAREKIIEMLYYTHVLVPPDNKLICIIAERRGIRGSTGREREDESPTTSASMIGVSAKKHKQKRRKTRNQNSQIERDGVALSGRFEDIAEADAKVIEMKTKMEFGILKALWETGEEKDRIEVGRREILLRGILADDSLQRINGRIRDDGGLPYSIPDYDTMKAMKKTEHNPWRLKYNFDQVCLLLSTHWFALMLYKLKLLRFAQTSYVLKSSIRTGLSSSFSRTRSVPS